MNTKETIIAVAIGGAVLNVAFSVSRLVGDLFRGKVGLMSLFNVVVSVLILYLAMNYEIASLIYGWLLLITTVLAGLLVFQAK
jgi:hypothetical protein